MARFLYAIWPFVGHINPFVGVAHALRARGHEVAFYTGASARPVLEGEGFPLFPFERLDERSIWDSIVAAERSVALGRRSLDLGFRTFQDWLVNSIPDQVADLGPIVKDWDPDVIIAETAMWGPIVVLWELLGRPVAVASTLMGTLIPGPEAPILGLGLPPPRSLTGRLAGRVATLAIDLLASPFRRRVNRIRGSYGLTPIHGSVNAFTAKLPLYLVGSIPELDYNRRDLPPHVHYIGPQVWSKPSAEPPPAWLNELPADRPLVHVTEGTVHYQEAFVLRAAAQGLANQPLQVVMTTGPQRDPTALDLGPPAANVRVERWVSHADLLPRCAALVTTGGAGTVMAALQAGVPLVIVPTLWDKVDNARRIVETGAGLHLPPWKCSPEHLRDAVRRVIEEPCFRENARRLAARLAAAPGPPRAAELLEKLTASVATRHREVEMPSGGRIT